ncbi:TRAP transporter substrate-binding protein DctP [Candidatus Entotheonella palauensis]|uniref:TRAP transporter substrate-binding protein DctP n=1 Tax=Candidatus Entotheonella palauensis TaxID=93172 RepID=UPI0015C4DB29|nr:TRAP transporter substrate-binding protein DctP [Candidatus Entotheonella palauensis]
MQGHNRQGLIGIILCIVLVMGALATTVAADAKYKLKFVGISRAVDTWPYWEKWAKSVNEKTGGQVEIELVSLPELGFGGVELIKLIKTGVVDVAEIYGGYVAGEMPLMEILELPGIFPDPETAKQAILAWKPTEAKLLKQRANAELLAMAAYPDQAIFSKKPIKTLEDFRGLKTRVHSVALSSLVAGLGGEPLSLAFAEVYTAMERGTVDAAFTGTKPGYDQRWYEVTKYLVGPISMRPHVALSVNRKTWKRLPEEIRKTMREEAITIVEDKVLRQGEVEVWNRQGLDNNQEKGMELMPFSPELRAAVEKTLREVVIPDWIKRAKNQKVDGKGPQELFNEIIAPLVGYKVGS